MLDLGSGSASLIAMQVSSWAPDVIEAAFLSRARYVFMDDINNQMKCVRLRT